MPSPVYSAGQPGNLLNAFALGVSSSIAAFLDLSSSFEGQVTCELATGGTPPTAGTTFSAYKVYGAQSANTLQASAAPGSTSISVSSNAGLAAGRKILIRQASGSKLGEIATIAGAVTGTGPYSVPVGATVNGYSPGDAVNLVATTPTAIVAPASAAGTWAANSAYSTPMFLGTGQWAIVATNTDTAQSVTATISDDAITAYA